jgi:aspartyl-tRNA(Asn)/glutamyl-tRNA(Gln) amidotransferase subunit A
MGMVPVAVGSDTGGSIRIPASFCGIAGLKPTYGLIGRTGGVALAPSFDTPGALGRSIEDTALLVSAMSGPDPDDPACDGRSFRPEVALPTSLAGVRIGVSDALVEGDMDAGVRKVYDQAIATVEELGAELVAVDLVSSSSALEAFVPLQMAEAYDVHHRSLATFPWRRGDYGDDVRSRLEAAAEVTVGDYLAAQQERLRLLASFRRGLTTVDAVVSPISAVAPSSVGNSDEATLNGETRPLRELVMPFTVPQNLTGLPTSIVRAGFDDGGMPVGVQLTADRWQEATAVACASALQFALEPIAIPPWPQPARES